MAVLRGPALEPGSPRPALSGHRSTPVPVRSGGHRLVSVLGDRADRPDEQQEDREAAHQQRRDIEGHDHPVQAEGVRGQATRIIVNWIPNSTIGSIAAPQGPSPDPRWSVRPIDAYGAPAEQTRKQGWSWVLLQLLVLLAPLRGDPVDAVLVEFWWGTSRSRRRPVAEIRVLGAGARRSGLMIRRYTRRNSGD